MGCSVMAAGSSREGEGWAVGPGEVQGRSEGCQLPLPHPLLLLLPLSLHTAIYPQIYPQGLIPRPVLNCLPGPEYYPQIPQSVPNAISLTPSSPI